MDIFKEKLIQMKKVLCNSLHFNFREFSCEMELDTEITAENLLKNGVTIQKWTSEKKEAPDVWEPSNLTLLLEQLNNDGKTEKRIMSNADRIRDMNDEQLAKFIMYSLREDENGTIMCDKTLLFTENDALTWLQQPVTEE